MLLRSSLRPAGPATSIRPTSSTQVEDIGVRDDPIRGILLILAAVFFFSCSDATSKYLTATLPALQVSWLRFAVFVAVMVPAVLVLEGRAGFVARQPGLQIVRAFGVLGSAVLFIVGLDRLPMAEATTMAFVSPIFVTALSIPFLGESVGVRRWAAVAVGLIGVIVVVRPGMGAFDSAAIYPILSALSWAVALVITRKTNADSPLTALTYAAVVGFIVLSVAVAFDWVGMDWRETLLGVFTGLTSTIAQWLIVLAYRQASASLLAPFFYSQLVWSAGLGFFVFGSLPDGWSFVGAAIIIASGLYTAHRERIRAKNPAAPTAAARE